MSGENLLWLLRLPKSHQKAKSLGETHFFTGKKCVNGHLSARYTKSKLCVECTRASNRARNKHRNPDKIKEYNASEAARAARKKWRKNNPKRYWASRASRAARLRAEKRGVPFDLTPEYVMSIMPDRCPVFGTELTYAVVSKNRDFAPSIDRIHPEKGYVPGNVVVVSMRANLIKSKYGSKDIYKVAVWLKKIGV